MIFQPRKAALYRIAVEHGIRSPQELMAHLPLGSSVPSPRLESWLQWLFKPPKAFSGKRRYINRFKIGADPEFVLASVHTDQFGRQINRTRADASALGLIQGPAFGSDNNGRLAEIRPHPSRSATEVVASILCTLRWMAICKPDLLPFEWLSGAFLWDDGIGGHVHFGRKRPTRKEEVAALDSIEEGLVYLGCFPSDQVTRRRQGDARRQIYGALGDFRMQQHGYEYRTFPSWLDSPELAFLTLVVSKLAVQLPSLYRFTGGSAIIEQARLRNFLAYFKGVDDDARLALMVLERGVPQHQGTNFAPRWGLGGIRGQQVVNSALPKIIPPSIKPDAASVQEVFDYLRDGKPLTFRVPEITWAPTAPPKGYRMCLSLANTIQAKGLGEMIWDLCCSDHQQITFVNGHRDSVPLAISRDLVEKFPRDWTERFNRRAQSQDIRENTIVTAPDWREGSRGVWMKKALLNGLLPLWRVKDCQQDSYKVWQEQAKGTPRRKFTGSVVYASQQIPL